VRPVRSGAREVFEGGEFLDQLTDTERTELERRGGRRRWDRGELVFAEDDRTDWVMTLLDGRVKVSSHTAAGVEVVLAVRGPGALLGELAAIDGRPRSATVTAIEPVTGLVVPFGEFAAYLQGNGRVAFLLTRLIAARLRDADRKRIEFGAYDTTGRVAARLVELAERFGEADPGGLRISLPLTQDELAGWVGASREAVSKSLAALRSRGWIETSRRAIVVRDLAALRHRAR
jgi:CRP/FNR family transcriptional regulator, cyclic AMP receptor protein